MAVTTRITPDRASRGRSTVAARRRPRTAPGQALAAHLARQETGGEARLGSNAGFASRRPSAPLIGAWRPRPVPVVASFVLTAIWFVFNDQHPSPLDVLPFAWTWLTIWLALTVALEVWRRAGPGLPTGPRRRA